MAEVGDKRGRAEYMSMLHTLKVEVGKRQRPVEPGPGASEEARRAYAEQMQDWYDEDVFQRTAEEMQRRTLEDARLRSEREAREEAALVTGGVITSRPAFRASALLLPGPVRDLVTWMDALAMMERDAAHFSITLRRPNASTPWGIRVVAPSPTSDCVVVVAVAPTVITSVVDKDDGTTPCLRCPLHKPLWRSTDGTSSDTVDLGPSWAATHTAPRALAHPHSSGGGYGGEGAGYNESRDAFAALMSGSRGVGVAAAGALPSSSTAAAAHAAPAPVPSTRGRRRGGKSFARQPPHASAPATVPLDAGTGPWTPLHPPSHTTPPTPAEFSSLRLGDHIIGVDDVDLRAACTTMDPSLPVEAAPSAAFHVLLAVMRESTSTSITWRVRRLPGDHPLFLTSLSSPTTGMPMPATPAPAPQGSSGGAAVAGAGALSSPATSPHPLRPMWSCNLPLPTLRALIVHLLHTEKLTRKFPRPAAQYFSRLLLRFQHVIATTPPPGPVHLDVVVGSKGQVPALPPDAPHPILQFLKTELNQLTRGLAVLPSVPGGTPDLLMLDYVPEPESDDDDVVMVEETVPHPPSASRQPVAHVVNIAS